MNLDIIRQNLKRDIDVVAVIDGIENGFVHSELGVPVIAPEERSASFAGIPVMLSMGSAHTRAKLMAELERENAPIFSFHGSPETVHESVVLSEGTLVWPQSTIGPFSRIGRGVHVQSNMVGHDVTVGDFTTLSVMSTVLGHVNIGSEVTVGPRAVIRNGTPDKPITIGDGAIIGIGAVVLRNVPPGKTVIGNPAMSVKTWLRLGLGT
jgi:sugar O-acyltransferase (sialic acid O-acetyltransferase NeuD family)